MIGKEVAVIIRLAGPIKHQYAVDHNLDYTELLSTSSYKENYRFDMIKWSEEIRERIPDYFIKKAVEMYDAAKFPVWIVSDARRTSDVERLLSQYSDSVTIRITASEKTREQRGWIFTKGVDDAASECDLDGYTKWDYTIDTTDSDHQTVEDLLQILESKYKAASS